MTAPASCRVEVAPTFGPHPLATLAGVQAFAEVMAASQHWRPLPTRQKAALQAAHDAALAGAKPGDVLPLPPLGADVHPATARALQRRGMVADGRLTALAVWVVGWWGDRRDRPIVDVQTAGERL